MIVWGASKRFIVNEAEQETPPSVAAKVGLQLPFRGIQGRIIMTNP